MTDELIPVQAIENKIFVIRCKKVMFDSDLALLYEIETFNLNKAVKRNINRFPEDFMFQLTDEEWKNLIFQNGISKEGRGGRRFNPYVFTEHGVLMLSSVLKTEKAAQVNIQIMRAFVKLREMALINKDLSKRIDDIEKTLIDYAKQNNTDIEEIFKQLEYLHDRTKPNQVGFKTDN